MIKVDKGVPLPELQGWGKSPKYPWASMKVGDSFFVPGKAQNAVSSCVGGHMRRHPGEHYTTRKEGDGVRVWRIAPPKGAKK